jgi:hypothetical protein
MRLNISGLFVGELCVNPMYFALRNLNMRLNMSGLFVGELCVNPMYFALRIIGASGNLDV